MTMSDEIVNDILTNEHKRLLKIQYLAVEWNRDGIGMLFDRQYDSVGSSQPI